MFIFNDIYTYIPLQSLGSIAAFQAMVSIATISMFIAYALPILCRITFARKIFMKGPFNLGSLGLFIGCVVVLWVVTITALFSLPASYPIIKDTLNYTLVAVGGLFIVTYGSWLLRASYWFKGPVPNIEV